jgi:hypothetical protein
MTRPLAFALVAALLPLTVFRSGLRSEDLSILADPSPALTDRRLGDPVTLDGYHPWQPITDLDVWQKRRERVRRQILVAAGLWPMPVKTPLRPTIHGKIDRGDYTVEKVFFESYPGFFVTGSLFRPNSASGGKKRAAVLCPHGHWSNGRFYISGESAARKQVEAGKEKWMSGARAPLQARCVQLARMGCVVFHYDMIGYADSRQVSHRSGFGDVEGELRLQSWFGLQTWNSIRAYDFVESLPDVDPKRIGATGASGGGTQTFILGAIDDRPAVLFPAVMVSTAMQGGCVCENASHLRVGSGNIEFAALAAPRPYGMTGANDWSKEIMTKGLPELKALWKAYGKESLVEAWCYTKYEHNYNQVSREHMYNWLNVHLKLGQDSPVVERAFEPLSKGQLSVFTDEHSLPSHAVDTKTLRAYLTTTTETQIQSLAPVDSKSLAEFRRVIGGGLEAILHTSLPAKGEVESSQHGEVAQIGEHQIRRLTIGREGSGEAVPALLITPKTWNGVVSLMISKRGKSTCFERSSKGSELRRDAEEVLGRGAAILSVDVFLTGEYLGAARKDAKNEGLDDDALAAKLYRTDRRRHRNFVGYTLGYNRTLLGHRVHDILTAVGYARSLAGAKRVHLGGLEGAGSWAILARALCGDAVDRTVATLRDQIEFDTMSSHDDPSFVPGGRKYGGMDAFAALCAPGEVWLVDGPPPSDLAQKAYNAAGKAGSLRHIPSIDPEFVKTLFDWFSS